MKWHLKSLVKKRLQRAGLLPSSGVWDGYTRDALALARLVDCNQTDLLKLQQHPERVVPVVAD